MGAVPGRRRGVRASRRRSWTRTGIDARRGRLRARPPAWPSRPGCDGVEIDAGAWSLLRQFQSGLTNQRADGYGEDRLRFTREVLAAVRAAVGPDRILALRLSCDELAPWAGITPEQAAAAGGRAGPGASTC